MLESNPARVIHIQQLAHGEDTPRAELVFWSIDCIADQLDDGVDNRLYINRKLQLSEALTERVPVSPD